MKLKRWLLPPLVVAALIALSGCSEPEPPLNTPSSVEVELVSDRAATVEGKYRLRFDTGLGQYVTLKKEAQALLLGDGDVQAPEGLRILQRKAVVRMVEDEEIIGDKTITSQVYELETTLTVAAVPEAAALQSTYDVVVSFPAALVVGRTLGASAPSSIPEVRFHVLHYPSNSARARGRIGKDLWRGVAFVLVATLGVLLTVAYYSLIDAADLGELAGCGLILLPFMGLVGVVLVGVGGTLFYLLLILRDLWWIVSRLWGG